MNTVLKKSLEKFTEFTKNVKFLEKLFVLGCAAQ